MEDALAAALVKVGAVTASNGKDLKKINWSRSSRTDKGVHALGGVVAFKCEFPPDHDFESDPEGLNMAQVSGLYNRAVITRTCRSGSQLRCMLA